MIKGKTVLMKGSSISAVRWINIRSGEKGGLDTGKGGGVSKRRGGGLWTNNVEDIFFKLASFIILSFLLSL